MTKQGTRLAMFVVAAAGMTTAVMAQDDRSTGKNPLWTVPGTPPPGIDVSISAIAAGTGGGGGIGIYGATSPGMPASGFFGLSATTVSCNVYPFRTIESPDRGFANGYNADGTTTGYPAAQWYAGWDGDVPAPSAGMPSRAQTVANPLTATYHFGERHPYIAINTYRINADGRMEQLAASWIKHGWLAASASQGAVAGPNGQPACGTGTCDGFGGNGLGANCSDTYGSGLNAAREWLGPRTEIFCGGTWNNPGWKILDSWLEDWNISGTIDQQAAADVGGKSMSGGTGQAWKINLIRNDEVNAAALGASGRVFVEGIYVINSDRYDFNNIASRRFIANGIGAGVPASSNFSNDGPHLFGPAMLSWAQRSSVAEPSTEGQVYVGTRVVFLPGGLQRYEYNVFNYTYDPEVDEVFIPLPNGALVQDVGVWHPRTAGPGYHGYGFGTTGGANPVPTFDGMPQHLLTNTANDPTRWTHTYDAVRGGLVFTPPTPPANQLPNTIRWGTMHTFWFTTDMPAFNFAQVRVSPRIGGGATELVASNLRGPRNPADIAKTDGSQFADGAVDNGDFSFFFTSFFAGCTSAGTPCGGADIAATDGSIGPDGNVDNGDFSLFFTWFFR